MILQAAEHAGVAPLIERRVQPLSLAVAPSQPHPILRGAAHRHAVSGHGEPPARRAVPLHSLAAFAVRIASCAFRPSWECEHRKNQAQVSSTLSMATHNLVNMVAITAVSGAVLLALLPFWRPSIFDAAFAQSRGLCVRSGRCNDGSKGKKCRRRGASTSTVCQQTRLVWALHSGGVNLRPPDSDDDLAVFGGASPGAVEDHAHARCVGRNSR